MGEDLYFNLTMFIKIDVYRYPAFVFCLLLYGFIMCANLVIIVIISREKTLHKPMYIFIACLSVNALYGSVGFFPRFLMDLLSDTHLISRQACFSQVYVIYTYASFELTILGIMAYDRYVAVCHALHYHRRMNFKVVIRLTALAYLIPVAFVLACLWLSVRLPLCGNRIHKIYCANWNIVKLSCVSTLLNNIIGLLLTVTSVFIPLLFVLYTYLRIVLVCWNSSAEYKGKIFQNCLPHIVSFATSLAVFCDIALSRIDIENINPIVAIIISMETVVIPPIVNPLMYSLKLPEIRKHVLRKFSSL